MFRKEAMLWLLGDVTGKFTFTVLTRSTTPEKRTEQHFSSGAYREAKLKGVLSAVGMRISAIWSNDIDRQCLQFFTGFMGVFSQ